MADRVPTQCEQCGQVDTHPKIHLGERTTHHDCLSFTDKQSVQASSEAVTQIIAAAEGGTHGDELLTFIQDLSSEEAN